MNHQRILVIIPAYNEEENIEKTIRELWRDFPQADILVVNDCSSDATEDIVNSLNVTCISHPFNIGYSGGLQTGFKYAGQHGYEYVLQFDGDGQHIAAEAKKMFEVALEQKTDIIIGSRYLADTGYESSFFRKQGSRLFSLMIRLICKIELRDPTSGLQVINRKTYGQFSKMNGYPEYPDANLLIEMIRSGYQVLEIPTKMRPREAGVSMHSGVLHPIKYMILMIYSIFIALFRKNRM